MAALSGSLSSNNPQKTKRNYLKLKNQKKAQGAKDFFQLAATIANPAKGTDHDTSFNNLEEDLSRSRFLDNSFQEKSNIFFLDILPQELSSVCMKTVQQKWNTLFKQSNELDLWQSRNQSNYFFEQPRRSVTRNGITFSALEIYVLLVIYQQQILDTILTACEWPERSLSPLEFHSKLLKLFCDNNQSPWLFLGKINGKIKTISIDKARLFWSHRLQMKSLQMSSGARPHIHYIHAALRRTLIEPRDIDIFYWLKYDDEKKPQSGGFIDLQTFSFVPLMFFCPHIYIIRLLTNAEFISISRPIQGLLSIYLEATADDDVNYVELKGIR